MKKLLFACASLMLISSAMAADGADVKINGEIRARFSGQENLGFTKNSWDNRTEQRTKLGFTFTKSEDLTAQVTLLARGEWGNADTNSENISGELENDGQASVVVYEAWAFWKAMDNVSIKLGRGALDLADGTIVSKNDYEQNPYSFEGIAAMYFHELVNLSIFGVKGMNDDEAVSATVTNDADVNFYAAAADFKVAPEYLKTFNIMALQSKATGIGADLNDDGDFADAGETGIKDDKLRLSLTLAGDTNGIDYRGTYAMYTGERNIAGTKADHKASMYDLEVGYTMKDIMNLRVAALYHVDSGDSDLTAGDVETYDPFFYNKHDNAGRMDLIGWGNSTYIKLGVSLEPMEMLTAGIDYYMFQKTEKADNVYGTDGSGLGSEYTTSATEDDVGSEIDLWVKKVLSNGAEIRAHYGMFQAGDTFGANKEDVSEMEVSATFRF